MLNRQSVIAALLVLSLSSLLAPQASAARSEIAPFEASYRVLYKGSKAGKANASLKFRDGQWQMRIVTRATGMFKLFSRYIDSEESSQFTSAEDGAVTPRLYKLERPGQKAGRKLLRIDFDDETIKVARDINEPITYDWPENGSWDRLSMLFNMPVLVGERSKGDVMLNVVSRHGPARRRLELLGRETINTPAGEFNTLRLRYHSGKRTVQYWIATTDGGIPIRLVYGEDGDNDGVLELMSLER